MRLACDIPVFAGDFASQPLVFAHLMDVAVARGLHPDFDHVEVIARPFAARLGAIFAADTVAELEATCADTLVLILPGAAFPLHPTDLLRSVGVHPGQITRAPIPEDMP